MDVNVLENSFVLELRFPWRYHPLRRLIKRAQRRFFSRRRSVGLLDFACGARVEESRASCESGCKRPIGLIRLLLLIAWVNFLIQVNLSEFGIR